jgi:dTDP-4-dehydrorhamnose reductase
MKDYVLPRPSLNGLYHVAAQPISKLDLLTLVAAQYNKDVSITADDKFVIDRSLDGTRFREATGYQAPAWPELVRIMWEGR